MVEVLVVYLICTKAVTTPEAPRRCETHDAAFYGNIEGCQRGGGLMQLPPLIPEGMALRRWWCEGGA